MKLVTSSHSPSGTPTQYSTTGHIDSSSGTTYPNLHRCRSRCRIHRHHSCCQPRHSHHWCCPKSPSVRHSKSPQVPCTGAHTITAVAALYLPLFVHTPLFDAGTLTHQQEEAGYLVCMVVTYKHCSNGVLVLRFGSAPIL